MGINWKHWDQGARILLGTNVEHMISKWALIGNSRLTMGLISDWALNIIGNSAMLNVIII